MAQTAQPPDTLPRDFANWDKEPPKQASAELPDTLPKDFSGWDDAPIPHTDPFARAQRVAPPEPENSPVRTQKSLQHYREGMAKMDTAMPQPHYLRQGHLTPMQRFKSAVGQTETGNIVESNLDQLGTMMKRAKQEAFNPGAATDAEWEAQRKAQREFFEKHLGNGFMAGAAIGGSEFLESLTSPFQVALMVRTFGSSALEQAAAKMGIRGAVPAAKTLSALIQAHFAASMIEGTASGAENFARGAIDGDWESAGQGALEGLASGLMAKGALTHEMASERIHRDLDTTAMGMPQYAKPFDQLNPYDQGIVIDETVKKTPEYREILQDAEKTDQIGKDQVKKARQKKVSKYYETAISKSFDPNAARRTVEGLQRAAEEDQRQQGIHEVVKTIRSAVDRRAKAIQEAQEAQQREVEAAKQAEREGRPARRQASAQARTERDRLSGEIRKKRDEVFLRRQETQPEPDNIAQRELEVNRDEDGNLSYPANYWGEENSFGVAPGVMGNGVYRRTPRGVEFMDANGNFDVDPDNPFAHNDPETVDTVARLSSLSATADTLADEDGATTQQKQDAELLAGIRRDLINGDITAKEAQKRAGIAEKVTLSDEHQAARDGMLTGPYFESSHGEYIEGLRAQLGDEEDVEPILAEAGALARQQTENNLNHVYRPGDYIVSKRGVKWTLDSKGLLHPDDGGAPVPLMRGGFYSNQAVQLGESGRVGYGTMTREERRKAAAKTREIRQAIRESQEAVSREMRLAKQAEGLQLSLGQEPREDAAYKELRQQRRMSRPPRAMEKPEGQIVRMIFRKPAQAESVINSIARAKETTPEEVMRLSLAQDPEMTGTVEQKIAGLEPGDRVIEPIRKKPWVVEMGKDGQTYLRSGNAQPVKLNRLNPSDLAKAIVGRGSIEKDVTPEDVKRVAFENPHFTRWQQDMAADVQDLTRKPAPEPVTPKQAKVQVQATKRRAEATESLATKALIDAQNPETLDVEKAVADVEKAHQLIDTAEEAYAQAVQAQARTEPAEAFPQLAPITMGLKGKSGVVRQNNRELPMHYELVPIDALIDSHEWHGVQVVENPAYPAELQPRTISDVEAQWLATQAEPGTYAFDEYADKTINGSMGPAIIEEGGRIVGGNSRILILRKHLSELEAEPDVEMRESRMAGMKARMRQLALDSGIARYPEDGKMYAVVRVLDDRIENTRTAAELGRLFNKKIGVEINDSAKGVSYSKSLTREVMTEIGRRVDTHDSLKEAIKADPDYFNAVVANRFDISHQEGANWFRYVGNDKVKQKLLSDNGINQFTKAVLGYFVKDGSLLNRLEGKTPLIALERALSHLLRQEAMPTRNITGKIIEAFRASAETDGTEPGLSRHSDPWAATYAPDQQDFLGMESVIPPEPDRMVEAIWRAMNAGNRTLNDRLKSFIGDESTAAMQMFEAHEETPVEAFNRAFQKELRQSAHVHGDKVEELTPDQYQAALNNESMPEMAEKEVTEKKPEQPKGQETAPAAKMQRVPETYRDFEHYAATRGASRQGYGDAGLHRGSKNQSERSKRAAIEAQSAKDSDLTETREALRREYAGRLERGEIKEMSPEERLRETASGHPDNQATQAAKRLLEKKTMQRPTPPKPAKQKLEVSKAENGYVTPAALRSFLETNPATKAHAPELFRTAKMMAEYVYDADPPVGVERKDALDWVLRERLAAIGSGELKSVRGRYSDPNIEAGMGEKILTLHKAADASTFIHEFAHVIFPLLSDEDMKAIATIKGPRGAAEWDGQRGTLKGEVYKSMSERLAHGLERFLRNENPTGFTHEVKQVLAKVKDMMRKVYMAFRGDPLSDYELTSESREVFAKMFGITDFNMPDDWREEVKKARAEEKKMVRPGEETHPVVKLAGELGAQRISNTIDGKVVDSIGPRVDQRKPTAVFIYPNQQDALARGWSVIGRPGSSVDNAELIAGKDGEWAIRLNTKSRVPPDILQQALPEKHPGVELQDLQKRLAETPERKIMERRMLQLRIDNLRNRIRAEAGVEEAEPRTEPNLEKAVIEEAKSARTDSVRKAADGVPRLPQPQRPGRLPESPKLGMSRHAGAGGKRDVASARSQPGVIPASLKDVTPVALEPLRGVRGNPVGTLKGEAFDQQKWADGLKGAGLPETLPPPTYALDPRTAQVLKFPGQKEIVQVAMSALEQGDGFVVASATGTGKTYTSMATAWEYRSQHPEAKVLVITKNRGLLKDATKVAANHFGMEVDRDVPDAPEVAAGMYGTTYAGILSNKIWGKIKWDLVLADESGEARNWFRDDNKQGKALIEIVNNSAKAGYYSATPFHSPMEYGYLTKLNLWPKGEFDKWIERNFAHEKIGDKVVARLDPAKQAKLRQQLIERGQLVSQAISYDGFNAHFGVVPVTDEMKRGLDRIREGFQRARSEFVAMGKKGMSERVAAFEATYTKAFLERSRIPQAIELARRAREQGWHVMVFSETSAEDLFRRDRIEGEEPSTYQMLDDAMGGKLSKIIPPFEDVYDRLKEEFGADIVDYSGRGNTLASRDAAKTDFLSGKVPIIYTTYAAGGIGVSLHDADFPELNVKGGDKPRVAIFLGPPYSGVLLEQAMGRPWRFGVKSDVHAVFLATDSEPDIHLMQTKVGPRMRALRAAVHGEKDSLASVMQTYTDEQKVRERQDMLAYAEGNEQTVTAANYQVRGRGRQVGIQDWSQINFPAAADAMHKGMKFSEGPTSDWANLYQSKFGMRAPDSPENAKAKRVIDAMANAAVTGQVPLLEGMEPTDRETITGLAAATATADVGIPVERDKDNTAKSSMDSSLKEGAFFPYQGITLTQEQGMVNIARLDNKPDVGYDLRRMNRSYRADWDMGWAQSWKLLEDSLKSYGFEGEKAPWKEIWNVVEGKTTSADDNVMKLAADISDMMGVIHDDLATAGVKVTTKGGDKIPYTDFPRDPHYMPHRIDWDAEMTDPATGERVKVRDFLGKDEQQQQRILDAIPELKPYSRKQVMDYLRRHDPRAPRQSNIHFAREVNFPFIKRDYGTLLGYFDQAAQAVSAAKNFGPENEILNTTIRRLTNPRGIATINAMFRAATTPQDWDGLSGKIYNAAVAFEAASKMTFSAFKVPFHLVLGPVALQGRVMPHIKAFKNVIIHPKEVMENAAYVGTIARQSQAAEMLYGERMNSAVRQVLRKELFEASYKMVRAISGEAARVYLDQYALHDLKKGGTRAEHTRRMLKEVMLIGEQGIDDAIAKGRFDAEQMAKAQTAFTNMAAFSGTGDPIQMPGMARLPMDSSTSTPQLTINRAIRLTYALQSFSVKAASLVREHLWDEVMVHKNPRPIAYALIAFPIIGTMLNLTGTGVRHGVQKGIEAATGEKHQQDAWDKYLASLEDDVEHPTALKFLKWYIDSVSLGIGQEWVKTLVDPLLNMAMGRPAKSDPYWWSDLGEHTIGPFFTDVIKTGEELVNLEKIKAGKTHPKKKMERYERSLKKYAEDIFPALRQVPQINQGLRPAKKLGGMMRATKVQTEGAQAQLPPVIQRLVSELNVHTVNAPKMGGYGDSEAIASVDANDPTGRIEVHDPARWAQGPKQLLGHETFHVWRRNLPGQTQAQARPIDESKPYDLSNIDELRKQGVTMATIPEEQGGAIVQRYIEYPEERARLQPWIDDMAKQGMSLIKPTDPNARELNTAPRPPSAPF